MLQAEVADRLLAAVGTRDYGVLTLLTALGADVEQLLALPPGAFRPVPAVRSALVRLTFRTAAAGRHPASGRRAGSSAPTFTQRRKTIANGLKALGSADGVDAPAVLRPPASTRCGARRRCSSLNSRHLRTRGRRRPDAHGCAIVPRNPPVRPPEVPSHPERRFECVGGSCRR